MFQSGGMAIAKPNNFQPNLHHVHSAKTHVVQTEVNWNGYSGSKIDVITMTRTFEGNVSSRLRCGEDAAIDTDLKHFSMRLIHGVYHCC
ncbi:MAG: hypothetical protein NPIRA02_38160 [Nitrospirales bacterium]|nr:MAG: hypothetical protein NPIRA02_38160 [Nitrospirales bacterium]